MGKLKKIVPVLILVSLLALPMVASAIRLPTLGDPGIRNLSEIEGLIKTVSNFIIVVGIVIVVIAIVYAGIMYAIAGDDTTKQGKAKAWLWNGVIAALIVLGVGVLMNTASNVVTRTFFR